MRQRITVLLFLLCAVTGVASEYDIVIRNGRVLDGAGNPWILADVAISEGRFVAIGNVTEIGSREIDATGMYVSPGWIDMMDQSGQVLQENGRAANKVLMGVTSAIGGEGGTPVPTEGIREYFETLERQKISINFGTYYNTFQPRAAVVGEENVQVSEDDLAEMQDLVRMAMEQGVVGLSSATFYPPLSFQETDELIALVGAMAPYGGIYAAHMRDESRHLLEAIEEMIMIGEATGVPVEIFHMKNAYYANWDKEVHEAIALIDAARARGVAIAADQYPYTAGGTGIDATIPRWLFDEGSEKAIEKLRDPKIRERLKAEIQDEGSDRMVNLSGGWHNIRLVNAHNPKYERFHGQDFARIGEALEKDPADAAWDIMLEAVPERAMALYFMMSEQDVRTIMRQSWVSIGSDAGSAATLGEMDAIGLPHPRAYGTFPRIIAEYVRETGVLSLEDAIRKMTSWPASRMKLEGRGLIKEGLWADVVVFDLETIQDRATWEQPMETPTGIPYVIVNGGLVVDEGQHTGATPGRVLYGPGLKREEEGF